MTIAKSRRTGACSISGYLGLSEESPYFDPLTPRVAGGLALCCTGDGPYEGQS